MTIYGIVARQQKCEVETCNAKCQPPHIRCSRHRPQKPRKRNFNRSPSHARIKVTP